MIFKILEVCRSADRNFLLQLYVLFSSIVKAISSNREDKKKVEKALEAAGLYSGKVRIYYM